MCGEAACGHWPLARPLLWTAHRHPRPKAPMGVLLGAGVRYGPPPRPLHHLASVKSVQGEDLTQGSGSATMALPSPAQD